MQKLPISISGFPELRKKNCVYVDKTKHIYSLLTSNCRSFLARPRRFGKSLLVTTLEAALQGKKELFDGLFIASSDYSWEPKGVIRLDFSQLSIKNAETFEQDLFVMLTIIAGKYNIKIKDGLSVNAALSIIITELCLEKEGKKDFDSVAILID